MKTRRTGSGQALVEFAIVLPILMLLVFALFDAGRAVVFYSELTNAARVGARVAMVNQSNDPTCSSLSDRTFKCAASKQTTGMNIAPSAIPNLVVTGSDCGVAGNCAATVSLSYSYNAVTPVIGQLLGPISLTANATMPIERNYASP